MKAINITIMFNGQAEAAFNFYKTIFGGEFSNFQRMKEIPGASPMPVEEGKKILHMALPIGNATLMGMDIPTSMPQAISGTNFMVTLDTSSVEETTNIFNRLSVGGNVMMPLGRHFWSDFFGMVTDQFGIQWMLGYTDQTKA